MTDLKNTPDNLLKIEQIGGDMYPAARCLFGDRFAFYAESDPFIYDEKMWWDTNPALSKEQLLQIMLENANHIRESGNKLNACEESFELGFATRQDRENLGKDTKSYNTSYSLTTEGATQLKQDALFGTCSYLVATQKLKTDYIRENGCRVGGRIYFGIDTQCGGIWTQGDLFFVHCGWSITLADISPWIGKIFQQTSRFDEIDIQSGLQKLLPR